MTKIAERTGGKVLEQSGRGIPRSIYIKVVKKADCRMAHLAAMMLFFIDITLRRFGMFKGFGGKRMRKPVSEEELNSPRKYC